MGNKQTVTFDDSILEQQHMLALGSKIQYFNEKNEWYRIDEWKTGEIEDKLSNKRLKISPKTIIKHSEIILNTIDIMQSLNYYKSANYNYYDRHNEQYKSIFYYKSIKSNKEYIVSTIVPDGRHLALVLYDIEKDKIEIQLTDTIASKNVCFYKHASTINPQNGDIHIITTNEKEVNYYYIYNIETQLCTNTIRVDNQPYCIESKLQFIPISNDEYELDLFGYYTYGKNKYKYNHTKYESKSNTFQFIEYTPKQLKITYSLFHRLELMIWIPIQKKYIIVDLEKPQLLELKFGKSIISQCTYPKMNLKFKVYITDIVLIDEYIIMVFIGIKRHRTMCFLNLYNNKWYEIPYKHNCWWQCSPNERALIVTENKYLHVLARKKSGLNEIGAFGQHFKIFIQPLIPIQIIQFGKVLCNAFVTYMAIKLNKKVGNDVSNLIFTYFNNYNKL